MTSAARVIDLPLADRERPRVERTGERVRVLVVDDEPEILGALEDLLEEEFDVVTAQSADRALELLESAEVAVILSDQRMAGMSGDRFLAAARERCEATRILFTGYSDLNAVVRAVNDGQIYAYVSKPWDPHYLRLLVHRAAEHFALVNELGRERDLLHLLMDNVRDCIYFKDNELRYLRINHVGARLLGVSSAADAIGMRAGDFLDADSARRIEDEERRLLEGVEPAISFDRPMRTESGDMRWHAVTKVPMRDANGTMRGLVGIARDVQERREAEDQLRQSEEHFRNLISGSIQGIFIHRDFDPLFVNDAFARIFGYASADDFLARVSTFEQCIAEGDLERLRDYGRARLERRPAPMEYEFEGVRADGASITLLNQTRVVTWHGVPAVQAVVVDVTDRKRAEAAVSLVNRITVELGDIGDIERALETTLRLVSREFQWALGEAWMPSPDRDRLALAAVWHEPDESLRRFTEISSEFEIVRGRGFAGRVWDACVPQWLPGVAGVPAATYERREAVRDTGLAAACGVPVIAGEEVIGVLVFYTREQREEDRARIDALTAAAAPLAAFLQRIAAEDALREADSRLNLALESAGVGTWEWDIVEDRVRWDPYMPPLYGLRAENAPRDGRAAIEAIHPEDRDRMADAYRACLAGGDVLDSEFRVVRPDGDIRTLAVRGRLHRGGSGRPLRMNGVCWDVTSEREAEAEIASLARFHLENPNPVLRIAADGRVVSANDASRAILDHWGTTAGDRVPDDVVIQVRDVLARDATMACEIDCEDRIFRLSLVPVGEHSYVNLYGEDVTTARRAEERVRQSQKMEAIGKLTGGVAHDFNNRLTVILGNLELLEMRLAEESGEARLAQQARKAAEGGAALTRQLLTFSRRQLVEPELVDVNARLRALEEILARTLGEAIGVKLALCTASWPVLADAGQLEDALLNLAVNARDAMPQGGQLTIETDNVQFEPEAAGAGRYVRAGDHVLVSVTDTGCGIPKPVLDRVFEPFFTTKSVGKGTGLGMSMVYGFVKQANGHVHVYSEEGVGTCVKIYLPRALTGTAAHAVPAHATAARHATRRARILLVEDDEGVRRIATDLLSTLGHTVVETTSAPDALEVLARDDAFDLVFTDIMMPGGITGLELADRIRERWPRMPLLFTSGYTEEGPFRDAIERGDALWVVKPYTRAKLAEKVDVALSRGVEGAREDPDER